MDLEYVWNKLKVELIPYLKDMIKRWIQKRFGESIAENPKGINLEKELERLYTASTQDLSEDHDLVTCPEDAMEELEVKWFYQ
ncbi:hypothetical protein CHS0354_011747 [Potamilus streckersoni]|uniref:Uncharacterized protein n=1 Tax=Potamilus streckersoni TaxID=2493646 RepID=A0AAE0TA68_9BIVA|nr:hypothetical protein CHS0354_011747 [Potamilus streckersoni]